MIAPIRPSAARTRLWAFIASFVLAFAGISHGLRAPHRPRSAAPVEALAMIGAPASKIDLAGHSGAISPNRPTPAACAMSYADPIQTARMIERFQIAQLTSAADPPAALQIQLSHRLASGRLVVLTDGKTVLSWPFDAPQGGDWGTLAHEISIPSGRHDLEVRILGAQDELLGSATLDGTIAPEKVVIVQADYRPKERPSLRLAWASSPEAGGKRDLTSSSRRKGEADAPTEQD